MDGGAWWAAVHGITTDWLHFHFSLSCFGEGNGNPLQCSCLENPMDGGAWWATLNGVAKSRTRLSDFTFTFHFHALEKERATHSSVLAWRIPGTGEPGGLPSMGLHRVGHDWRDLAAAAGVYKIVSYPTEIYCNHWLIKCLFSMWHWNNWLFLGREEVNEGF